MRIGASRTTPFACLDPCKCVNILSHHGPSLGFREEKGNHGHQVFRGTEMDLPDKSRSPDHPLAPYIPHTPRCKAHLPELSLHDNAASRHPTSVASRFLFLPPVRFGSPSQAAFLGLSTSGGIRPRNRVTGINKSLWMVFILSRQGSCLGSRMF